MTPKNHLRINIFASIIIIIIMIVSTLNIFSISANGENVDTITLSKYYIESRFILWDLNEKMIDDTFIIHLYYINISNNNTSNYYIQLDNNIYEGEINLYKSFDFNFTNGYNINKLIIKINNETILNTNNIKVVKGVNSSGIKRTLSEYTVNLSPFEWSKKEWNIFYSIVISALLSMIIGYRSLKYYRKKNGIKIIRG